MTKRHYNARRSEMRGELTIDAMSEAGRSLLMNINGHYGKRYRLIERSSSRKYYDMPLPVAEALQVEDIDPNVALARTPIHEVLSRIDQYAAGVANVGVATAALTQLAQIKKNQPAQLPEGI